MTKSWNNFLVAYKKVMKNLLICDFGFLFGFLLCPTRFFKYEMKTGTSNRTFLPDVCQLRLREKDLVHNLRKVFQNLKLFVWTVLTFRTKNFLKLSKNSSRKLKQNLNNKYLIEKKSFRTKCTTEHVNSIFPKHTYKFLQNSARKFREKKNFHKFFSPIATLDSSTTLA